MIYLVASEIPKNGKGDMLPSATTLISSEYLTLITTANVDWQIAEYVRLSRIVHEGPNFEIRAAAIWEVATEQHGDVFARGVANY